VGDTRDDAKRQVAIDKKKCFATTPAEFRVTRYLPADEPDYSMGEPPPTGEITEIEDRSGGIAAEVRRQREAQLRGLGDE